jgi:23S rRNA (cytidine1920-2'-O)/16S rRNA (cytidine1409-2'-O)-methyltransferase
VKRRRLDRELVRRGLADTEADAAELIAAGKITVGGAPATSPRRQVLADEALLVLGESPRFVTRAGAKLEAALDRFGLDVTGLRVLDAGASGGGFTDCLLQRGAAEVVAVDVGYGLIHERLRADARVTVVERTNVRSLEPGALGPLFPLVVGDLSFISLRTVARNLVGQAADGADLALLVKPQFEATRAEASRGEGVVRDPDVHRRVLAEVAAALTTRGADVIDAAPSPVTGSSGNVEYLLHAVAGDTVAAPADGGMSARPAGSCTADLERPVIEAVGRSGRG